MPFQKVEYSFPDEEKDTSIEVEGSGEDCGRVCGYSSRT